MQTAQPSLKPFSLADRFIEVIETGIHVQLKIVELKRIHDRQTIVSDKPIKRMHDRKRPDAADQVIFNVQVR